MRTFFKFSFYLIIILLLVTKTYSAENKILLKVNNQIITTIDILNEIQFLSIMNTDFINLEKNKKIEIAKNSLIRDKIKLVEILKFRKNIELEEVIFENIIKDYFYNLDINNIDEFEKYFNKQNLNTKFVENKIIIDTFWKQLIYEKFSKNVKIDEKEIKRNLNKNDKQKEYLLSEIVFNLTENENLEDKKKLIFQSINNGNFSEAALNFSISNTANSGGKLGWIKENILSKKIKNEIDQINIGDHTRPIVIPGGFIILKVEDLREIKIDIDKEKEVKSIIIKKTNEQLNRFSNIYLNKLKKNIQINEI